MGSPSSTRKRYPSPLIKQDLAKLGKDAESRRAALVSLRSVVEEHLDSTSLPRFLQQIEDSREGRRHVAPILKDLARAHGPSLAPHIPRLLHLLVHNLLASTSCPALLTACADAVASVARYCAGNAAEDVLRQVCLPLLALLPNKIPPLSTGAAVCLRLLVDSEQWRYAPAMLVDDICWKAAMAAAAPPTQTVAHIHLLRALATANASAISKFAPPLLRLSLDILLTPAATTSWQLRLSAVHLLESLLKAADYTALAAHLHPSLAALAKCRRHDKLPQVRNAVLQALQTAEALQRQQTKHSIKPESAIANHRRQLSDPFSKNTHVALPSQISPSPLISPRRLNSLSARAAANDNAPTEPDYFFPYFYNTEEISASHKIVHHIQEPHPASVKCAKPSPKPSPRINTRKPSLIRQVIIPSLHLPTSRAHGHPTTEFVSSSNADKTILHSAQGDTRYVPEVDECEASTMSSSATREIMVLGSNDELLASCERNLLVSENYDHLGCERKSTLRGQFAEAKFAGDNGQVGSPLSPRKRNQAVNTEDSKQQNRLDSMLDVEGDASAASVHLFNSLAQLATVDKCEQRSLPLAESSDHLHNENEILPPFPLTDFKNSATAHRQNPAEPVDTEAETSSGEWSVRDNPIAEDHSEDMAKHKDINPWPHISTSLPGEINKNWTQSGAGLEKDSQSEHNNACARATIVNEVPPDLAKNALVHERDTHHGFVSEEYWTEIEEMRDQTASSQCTWKPETRKPSQVHNRLHFKLLLCAALLVSVTMTVLTMELQHHAAAQYLPPT